MRDLKTLKKLPVCLIVLAAAACSGSSGGNNAASETNGATNEAVTANETAVASEAAAAPAENATVNTSAPAASTASSSAAASYAASGTEPFWDLTIGGGQMTYTATEGPAIIEPLPTQTPVANGYRYQGSQLTVTVTHTSCNNGMSERVYADTVIVAVRGENRSGCGGASSGHD